MTSPNKINSQDILELVREKQLDAMLRDAKTQLDREQLFEEIETETDRIIEDTCQSLRQANLPTAIEREISILLDQLLYLRKMGNIYLVRMANNAINLLLNSDANTPPTASQPASEKPAAPSPVEHRNLIIARRIRRRIRYEIFVNNSQSTMLILGLAGFIGLFALLPSAVYMLLQSTAPSLELSARPDGSLSIQASRTLMLQLPSGERRLQSGDTYHLVIPDGSKNRTDPPTPTPAPNSQDGAIAPDPSPSLDSDDPAPPPPTDSTPSESNATSADPPTSSDDDLENLDDLDDLDDLGDLDDLDDLSSRDNPDGALPNTATAVTTATIPHPFLSLLATTSSPTNPTDEPPAPGSSGGAGSPSEDSADIIVVSQRPATVLQNPTDFFENVGINLSLLLIVVIGGALGSSISVIIRAQNVVRERRAEPISLFFTGLLKPIVGIAFAIFIFAALESGLVSLGNREQTNRTYLYLAIAFVAGFSERFVQDILVKTEQTITPLSHSEQSES